MAEGKELTEWAPFQIMEKIEDETILAEIRGEVLKDYVYSFTDSSGRKVEGLSKAGVDAVVADLAKQGEAIRELDLQWTEDEKSYKATVRAGRYAISRTGNEVLLDSAFGAKRQSKTFTTKDGDEIENPFAFELAIVKAARNAKRRLIPESLAVEIIARAKTEGKTRIIPPTYPKSEVTQTRATAKVGTKEEVLKKLRQQVGIEAGKVFKTDEERKTWQKKEYDVDSMTQLSEDQLKDMLSKMKAALATQKPDATKLGFSSPVEQTNMRRELFDLLRACGKKTDEQIREYFTSKAWGKTIEMSKEQLEKCIEEVKKEKALVDEAESISEEL